VTASSYIVYACTTGWTYGPVRYLVCTHFYTIIYEFDVILTVHRR